MGCKGLQRHKINKICIYSIIYYICTIKIINLIKIMKTSQKTHIRNYLENGGKLTWLAALNFWDCANLKGRIWDIKQDYFDEWLRSGSSSGELKEIDKTMVKTASGKYVAQYFLVRTD